jgi:diguanylate cyclase (GGDEF)-like protein
VIDGDQSVSTFEYTIYGIRQGWRITRTFLFAGAFAAAVAGGLFSGTGGGALRKGAAIVLFAIWAAILGAKAHRRFARSQAVTAKTGRTDLELGILLVVGVHALVQVAGGLSSALYPLIFVLVAFLVVYTRQWIGFALIAATIGIELALVAVDPSRGAYWQVAMHAVFIVLFSALNMLFTRAEMARMRRRTERQIEQAKTAIADDARDFRFTAAATGQSSNLSREEETSRLSRCTVGEVRRTMYHNVDLLKRTMGLHTCLLLWLDARGRTLRVLECVSDSAESIVPRRFERGAGVVGAVLQSKSPMALKGLKPGYPGIPYYEGAVGVTDFLGVPVVESGSLRGVLCADRADGRPFGKVDEENLVAAADSILRTVANERIFTQLQKAKSEQGKLLRASDALSSALKEDDVVDAALTAAEQIARFDIAAVALALPGGKQQIRKAAGEGADQLAGLVFDGGSSLAESALKTRHFLPYRGEFDPKQQVVFTGAVQQAFAGMRSALVLPLSAGEEALGTLTLATASPSAYGEDVRTTLQVLTNQLGTALLNAQMVERLEQLATTDGLTGLPNHRVFQEELDRQLAAATRFNNEMSVLLCDVDHFKQVNDTYGHPVGDTVLRGLAETLQRNVVRDTDLPARYGGEEFAIVCAGTDTKGAIKLAERIRADLEGQTFHTDKGDLQVTISIGISTFPHHARQKATLVERADLALYAAKEGGRNQVRLWSKDLKQK